MKKIITILLICLTSVLGAVEIDCARQLRAPVQKILSFPKARATVEQVNSQIGKIRIKYKPISVSTQNGMWQPHTKSIILNSKRKRSEGETIRVLLFEMHNAKNQEKFFRLNDLARKRMISREKYIRGIEFIEYQNVLETAALLDEGIQEGYYPKSAKYLVDSDFEQHLALQRRGGHSQYIGQQYDQLVSS